MLQNGSLWKRKAIAAGLNGANPLAKGLIFAWSGNSGMDLCTGIRPVNTGVTQGTTWGMTSWDYSGGTPSFSTNGPSDLNFGTGHPVQSMGTSGSTSTWAFYGTCLTQAATQFAACCDNNNSEGWQLGYRAGSNALCLEIVYSGSNLRHGFAFDPTAYFPNSGEPFSVVCTYDGSQ